MLGISIYISVVIEFLKFSNNTELYFTIYIAITEVFFIINLDIYDNSFLHSPGMIESPTHWYI